MKHTHKGNFFSLPNEVFLLGLSPGELAVYSYLRRCENRKTHQCWPSHQTSARQSECVRIWYANAPYSWRSVASLPRNLPRSSPGVGKSATGICSTPSGPSGKPSDISMSGRWQNWKRPQSSSGGEKAIKKQGRVSPQEPLCAALPKMAGTDPGQGRKGGFGAVSEGLRGTKEKAG